MRETVDSIGGHVGSSTATAVTAERHPTYDHVVCIALSDICDKRIPG